MHSLRSTFPSACSLALLGAVLCACPKKPAPVADAGAAASAAAPTGPTLQSVGPRLVSNQTSQPLSIQGERLVAGLSLHLGPPLDRDLPLTVLDERHAFTRLPAHLDVGILAESSIAVTLTGGAGEARLTLANDTAFPDLVAFAASPDGSTLFAASATEDALYALTLKDKSVKKVAVGDGPIALAPWKDAEGRGWMVVAHQFEPSLRLVSVDGPGAEVKTVPSFSMASGLLVEGNVAYVAEAARDTVTARSLPEGKELWRTPVAANPRAMALIPANKVTAEPTRLVVGSLQTGLLETLNAATGAPLAATHPWPGTPIIGGGTQAFSKRIMGGKAVRALHYSTAQRRLLVSSIGPNIGPNPERMEVSMNAGVGVVEATLGWQRHLGFGAGVTEGLAVDEARGLLYATDIGLGLVRVLDLKKLVASDEGAKAALLQEVALPVREGFPLVRKAEDFNVAGRAGPSLHSGPKAALLSADGKTLYVLNRFTGTVAFLDVAKANRKQATWTEQVALTHVLTQKERRLGQVLYFADLGRTAMTCDACHLEGHTEGVLFEKTSPMRIYRSTSVRGSRETPPYFTPASTFSMGETAKVVGGRNRFHNPDPSPTEVEALTLYASLIPTLPNPFVGEDGAPTDILLLPDGATGNPRAGLALFEGKAACAECHPAPLFTTDQDPATRNRFIDVGTPRFMPLRLELQDKTFKGFAAPSLLGSWDVFPMLTTGLAGLGVQDDGSVTVTSRFALRPAVEQWAPTHGRADLLSPQERNDLLAYVLSL